ncbi:hypothetical protein WA026_015883 [Henosepilachna vigintioctopunctata]|uniref:Tyrosyl-DNA phosphodiesterase n=1 Tax=Henosepilachna vigintioctopunctata TaxID=420089 RepID=A0AAW1V2R0_9CUCU
MYFKPTQRENSIHFSDLLCPSLEKLKGTLQINYKVDFEWLINQYQFKHVDSLPITIVGGDGSLFEEYMKENFSPQITHYSPNMERGLHHTKIGIHLYDDDSLRVIVSTANLYQEDWDTRNQALWLSPRCPPMNDDSTNNGDSPTGFKNQLLKYLKAYDIECLNRG